MTAPGRSAAQGLRYGLLALPLAFAGLPLYVLMPAHYASLGAPLAGLGAVLLACRALDAVVDPWLGGWIDRGLSGPPARLAAAAGAAGLLLAVGFAALFAPPALGPDGLLLWAAGALLVTCAGASALGVLHLAWGSRLGGGPRAQARITAWREGAALVGVMAASVLPAAAGMPAVSAILALWLGLALWALAGAPRPRAVGLDATAPAAPGSVADDVAVLPGRPLQSGAAAAGGKPWRQPAFRALMAVFVLNGTAAAVPATLVLFYIRDRLVAPDLAPAYLAGYFAVAALSLPLWVRVVGRVGLVRAWLAGMGLAVGAFVWAAALGRGDTLAFALICGLTGAALGADLAVPAALLTGVLQRAGDAGRREGVYAGWWACANKLNLALAAGVSLPLLQLLGYEPGRADAEGLRALSAVYAGLPCALKLAAAAVLWHQRQRLSPLPHPLPAHRSNPTPTPAAP